MKKNIEKNRNGIYYQDINDKLFINRIYRYFYSLTKEKKELKSFIKIIGIIIETIQFISFSFSSAHYNSWKLDENKIDMISKILEGFRLKTFFQYLKFKEYLIIFYIILGIIFILWTIVILNIIFINSESKLYRFSITIIHSFNEIISIVFSIPIIEILLMSIKCVDGKIDGFKDGELCWNIMHYIYFVLGIMATLLFLIWNIFMIFFSFYPFPLSSSTIRITSNNEILILFLKLFAILQSFLISNEYISVAILFLISIIMSVICHINLTYNNNTIEALINIKNLMILYTNCVLLMTKIFQNVTANGFIYFLIFGYPLIIYLSIIISNEKYYIVISNINNFKTINDFIAKAKFIIKLVNSFLERNQNIRHNYEIERNITLLKGNIKYHNLFCTDNDCPLTKFISNEGNINVQSQCLLNYINRFFIKGIKMFPNNFNILILIVYFNFSHRFNLNNGRLYLDQIKHLNCGIKEKYIIYCLEKIIEDKKNNDLNMDNDKQKNNQADLTEQKYQKLKYLIENSIKYYSEFWGIFSTNISSKINTNKLYNLGEKLNIYLNEMNNLWDNELKNKKIDNNYQNIVQLYSRYLLEVLWDQKKSKEIYKKLNDDNLNNYIINNNKIENEKGNNNNIESLIDNQEFLLFAEYDEKKNCKIVEISLSFSSFLCYQKSDLIGKSIQKIFPNILFEGNNKFLENYFHQIHDGINNHNDLLNEENNSLKNAVLNIVKNRMGYIYPIYCSFNILIDNDYSDSFLIKYKFENNEPKSEYAYFILTNDEFSIENISSSAINLGLTLDLLKKYIVKINILLRTIDDKELNINENFNLYEEESKEVIWVFPDIIYPKDDTQRKKEDEIEELIKKSKKKKINLQIKLLEYKESEDKFFLFKFTEIHSKQKIKKINEERYIPKVDNKLIMFYLSKLSYIRAHQVEQKSGLRNLKFQDNEIDIDKKEINKSDMRMSKKKRSSIQISDDDSSENSKKNLLSLTKEKIFELQNNNFIQIRNFIFSLPIFGTDVALERFRPNGDKYSASKISESRIKIKLTEFCKRIDEVAGVEKNLKSKSKKYINQDNNVQNISQVNLNNDNYLSNNTPPDEQAASSSLIHGEESNKGLIADSSSSLSNIFKGDVIKYISLLFDLAFILSIGFIIIEFIITNNQMNKLKTKINFMKKGDAILCDLLYIYQYVIESVLSNSLDFYYRAAAFSGKEALLYSISKEMALIRQEISEIYNTFTSNDLSEEYKNLMNSEKIDIYTLTIKMPDKITLLYNNGINRITSSINNLASNPLLINMDNRDTYELVHNLLNNYFIFWYDMSKILTKDAHSATKLKIPLLLILFGYLIISIIILVIFLKLLAKYSLDREKPINLFLTIKKVVFEELKNSADNFSNQLLNKFFGNEENDQDSQKEYKINIKENDINIAKFKALNEYNSSFLKAFDFIIIIIIITIFFLLIFIYFIAKYINFRKNMDNIDQFITLFNALNIAHADVVITVEIFKSTLFNKSIPILDDEDTIDEFVSTFLIPTERFEDIIILTSKTKSFLSGEYLKKFEQYLLDDYSDLLDQKFDERNSQLFFSYVKYGIKPVELFILEILRFYTIKYISSSEFDINNDEISIILAGNEYNILILNMLLESLLRKWYSGMNNLMIDSYYDFHKKTKTTNIILFVLLIIIVILYYLIIWKIYQEKLNILLKESINLINLIPQEIKNIIIEKIVE